jgi:predicted RNA binding protein YcfA (HicA-like mRNA interferase family)
MSLACADSRYSSRDIINKIVKALLKLGWEPLMSRGHPRIKSPDGKLTITVPKTPSDHRSTQDWIHQLKHCGVAIPQG